MPILERHPGRTPETYREEVRDLVRRTEHRISVIRAAEASGRPRAEWTAAERRAIGRASLMWWEDALVVMHDLLAELGGGQRWPRPYADADVWDEISFRAYRLSGAPTVGARIRIAAGVIRERGTKIRERDHLRLVRGSG